MQRMRGWKVPRRSSLARIAPYAGRIVPLQGATSVANCSARCLQWLAPQDLAAQFAGARRALGQGSRRTEAPKMLDA